MNVKKHWPYLYIAAAAVLWGIIAIFIKSLAQYGFTPLQIVAIRVITTSLILVLYLWFTNRLSLLRISLSDIIYFIGTGIVSIVFFNWCYFSAIQQISVSIAAILLYTAPAFVTILARLFFDEQITATKLTALLGTFIGCALITGVIPHSNINISLSGLLLGLGSGLGYALYSIFGKFALRNYTPLTVTTYTFIIASTAVLPFSGLWKMANTFYDWRVMLLSLGLGLFPTTLAYLLYTAGLHRIETSKASITSTLEPIAATAVGIFIFNETLYPWQVLGIVLIIAAVIAIQKE